MFKRHLTSIQNNHGLSLIEIMVAGALLSIIGVGVGSIINDTTRSQRGLQAKDQQREVVAEIRTMLNSKVACSNTFGGQNPNGTGYTISTAGQGIRDGSASPGVVRYAVGSNHSSGLLNYTSFQISGFTQDPTAAPGMFQGKAVLTVRLDKMGQTLGVRQLVENINMQVKLNAAGGTIVECFSFGSQSDGIWQISTADSSRIYYSGGNVGVNTSNPSSATLQVEGSIRARFGPTNGFTFTDNPHNIGSGDAASLRYIVNGGERTSLILQNGNDPRGVNTEDDIRIRAAGGVIIETDATPTGQRMMIDSNGNVGIGTTPNFPSELLVVGNDIGNVTTNKAIVVADATGDAELVLGRDVNNLFALNFRFNGGASYVEFAPRRLGTSYSNNLVLRDGNVGIGTSTPIAKLHVENGNVFVNGTIEALAYHWTSDKNLKNIIKKSDGISAIKQLNGYHFSWKMNGKKDYGVIAQEVEKVFPELVTDKNGYKSVNYMGLVAPLIESVKELKERQAKLKKKIEKLENKLAEKRKK